MNAAVLKKQQGSTGSSLIPLKDLRFQDTFTKELTPDPQTPHGPARYKGDRGDAISSSSSSAAAAVAGSFHNPFATSGSVSDLSCPFPDSVVRTSRLVRHSAYTFLVNPSNDDDV